LLGGCDKTVGPETEPPAMLPPDVFTFQADLFEQGTASKSADATHFTAAALRVWPVSLVIGANLIIPAAVTAAAVEAGDPALEDGVWQWASSASADSHHVQFTLSAEAEDDHINWSMRISHTNPETGEDEEFVLYTAQTNPNTGSGTWQLFYPVEGEVENVLNATFEVRSETDKEITFSAPAGDGLYAGDTVTYIHDGSERTFEWHEAGENQTHIVTWNVDTHAGSITSPSYNGGQKACWDSQLQNTACSL
jgi:hypothetical protein